MCLYIDEKETRLIKRRFAAAKAKGKNYIVCYKILRINWNKKMYSPFYPKEYKPGWNKSNRKTPKLTRYEKLYINKGIHVMTSKSDKYVEVDEEEILIPVYCYKKDLISGGQDKEAVFSKVFITRKDYDDFIRKYS